MKRFSTSHPDYELLTLCAEWQANSKAFDKLCEGDPSDAEVSAFYTTKITAVLCRVAKTKARTTEGTAAKAGVLWRDNEVTASWPDGSTGKILRSILRDVMAMGSTATSRPTQEAA